MTGPSLHGIQGRFLKDGSTEYRAMGPEGWRGRVAILQGTSVEWTIDGVGQAAHCTTRKAAIERIEQLLCGGVTV